MCVPPVTQARVATWVARGAMTPAAAMPFRIGALHRTSYTDSRKPRGGSRRVPASARRAPSLERRSCKLLLTQWPASPDRLSKTEARCGRPLAVGSLSSPTHPEPPFAGPFTMEQDQNVIATLISWVAEEIVTLAVGSVIGAIGAKWFFGRKNIEELRRLRREVDELKRDGDGRTPAPPLESAPAATTIGSKIRSVLPASNPPDALLSPKELLALVEGHTDMAADRMLKPHKGRRHLVRGVVREVSDYGIDGAQVTMDGADGTTIVLWFAQGSQVNILETLRRGHNVSATGLLRYARNHIALEDCTLRAIDGDNA